MNILRKDEEGEKLKEEGSSTGEKNKKKKCSLSLGCPFCHPISYASGLCLCGEGEGGGAKGGGRLGPINNQ